MIRSVHQRLTYLETFTRSETEVSFDDWLKQFPEAQQAAFRRFREEYHLPLPRGTSRYQTTIAVRHLQKAIASGDFTQFRAYVEYVHETAKRNRESN